MKKILLLIILIAAQSQVWSQQVNQINTELLETNKEIARNFYQDLWFTNNTGNYSKYVSDEYVAHDIGDRKGLTETAIEQKNIADFFWNNGTLSGEIQYQIAEGNLVATRWVSHFEPRTLLGKIIDFKDQPLPIINVFRIQNGKIVELWNHRHDIDSGQTLQFTLQGLAIGLLIALIPTFIAIRLRRKIKKITEY